jgi:hypothetical protein
MTGKRVGAGLLSSQAMYVYMPLYVFVVGIHLLLLRSHQNSDQDHGSQ